MARVDKTSVDAVDKLAVRTNGLEQCLKLGMNKVLCKRLKRDVGLLVKLRIVYHLLQYVGNVDENHRYAVAYSLYGWQVFGFEHTRSVETLAHLAEYLHSLLGILVVACGLAIFCHGYGCEALAEHVATLAERCAVGCHFKEHVAVGVEAVGFDKVDGRLGCVEPLLTLLYIVVGIAAGVGKTSLEPYRLGGVHKLAVACNAGIDTSVLTVEAVLHPERHNVLDKVFAIALCPIA